MREFYNKALTRLLCLLLATCLAGYFCFENAFLKTLLLPAGSDDLPWHTEPDTDVRNGGDSVVLVHDDKFSLNFDIKLTHTAQYPHAAIALVFGKDSKTPQLADLSGYDKISFSAKCSAENMLGFSVATFDQRVTKPGDLDTYRTPTTFFSCNTQWNRIEIDLTRLEILQWWFDLFKVGLSDKHYKLDQVARMTFGNSFQSPMEIDSNIQITEITLTGRNPIYLYLFGAFAVLIWSAFGFWFFRQHTQALVRELKDKTQRDRPLIAYQQLSVESHRDRDRSAILHFMATQYSNTELSLDGMATAIGVSRSKINDILKSELGFTFTGYLNKLRLTEAARLLAQTEDANIAEIAYSVGYKNVSYFNKLFKEEYSCTPKMFKTLSDKTSDT